jgi:hypothetical protein
MFDTGTALFARTFWVKQKGLTVVSTFQSKFNGLLCKGRLVNVILYRIYTYSPFINYWLIGKATAILMPCIVAPHWST